MTDPTMSPYRSIDATDADRDPDHDESYSTTDVESVLLETKEWHDVDLAVRSPPETRSWWRRPRRILDTALIAVNVALTVVLLAQLRTIAPSQDSAAQPPSLQVGGDPSGTDPACQCRPVHGSTLILTLTPPQSTSGLSSGRPMRPSCPTTLRYFSSRRRSIGGRRCCRVSRPTIGEICFANRGPD
jgi:hypothetical protein